MFLLPPARPNHLGDILVAITSHCFLTPGMCIDAFKKKDVSPPHPPAQILTTTILSFLTLGMRIHAFKKNDKDESTPLGPPETGDAPDPHRIINGRCP